MVLNDSASPNTFKMIIKTLNDHENVFDFFHFFLKDVRLFEYRRVDLYIGRVLLP